jgi:5-oxoprolinase (ATP-hydrolysing) subunit A
VRYVKPHGALYTTAAVNPAQAGAIAAAVSAYDTTLPLLGQAGSELAGAAEASGLPFVAEAFADRAYQPDGRLVPRSQPGALLADPSIVVAQALDIVTAGRVRTVDGGGVAVTAESLCLHGDTPGAVDLALAVRAALEQAGVDLAPFAG